MICRAARPADLEPALGCLVPAFAEDPITGFLLQSGPGYRERLTQFFSLLMRARFALDAPIVVADDDATIRGAAMGYATTRPAWPPAITQAWEAFEHSIPGVAERMAEYEAVAGGFKPAAPHWYLGVVGVDPAVKGLGVGRRLLAAFVERSLADLSSRGVYLETANPDNVPFYERAGFVETGRGRLGSATLWCMFRAQGA